MAGVSNNTRGSGGFFSRLFSGGGGNGARRSGVRQNFRDARALNPRAPQVIAQGQDSRLVMVDDNSLGATVARSHFTRQYGAQAAASVGRGALIEVQDANGNWVPVNQGNPGASMDGQLAALQAFRQTGQIGAPNQTGFVGENGGTATFGAPTTGPVGAAGAANGNGTGADTSLVAPSTAIAESSLPPLTGAGPQPIPQDPNQQGTLGNVFGAPAGQDGPFVGLSYRPIGDGPGGPNVNAPTPPAVAEVRVGNAGNASGQSGDASPNYDADLNSRGAAALTGNASTGGKATLQNAAFSDPSMQANADAIASIESAGEGSLAQQYQAMGPRVTSGAYAGQRAYGRYQVMEGNIGPWTEQALGERLTPEQFLASPAAQDAVFEDQFRRNIEKYGSAQDAASVWFTGRPTSDRSAGSASDGYTTGNEYVQRFNDALAGNAGGARGGPNPTTTAPEQSTQNETQTVNGSVGDGTATGGGGGQGQTNAPDQAPIQGPQPLSAGQFLTARGGGQGSLVASAAPQSPLPALAQRVAQYKFF